MQERQTRKNVKVNEKRYRPDMKCEELIQNIREICEKRRISYYALAKEADVSPSTLHELMTGKTKPYLYTVYKICNALDISISELLREEDILGEKSELSKTECELILLYRKCSGRKREHLEIFLKMLEQFKDI